MGELSEEDRTKAAELLSPLISENQALREKVEELEAFWPAWALKIKATLEDYGVEFDDDEVDLPAAFDEWCVDFEEACKRDAARSEAQPSGYDGGKSLGERFHAACNGIGASEAWAWETLSARTQGLWDQAALTFTASLSDASPKPAEGGA